MTRKLLVMRRKVIFGVVLAVALVTLTGCTKTPSKPLSDLKSVRLVEGEYLSTAYIDDIKKTRSPLNAGSLNPIGLVFVRRYNDGALLETSFRFHEGGDEFLVSRDGSISPFGTAPGDVPKLTARVLDENTFELGYGAFKPAKYVFVRDSSKYVSKLVLVGKYKDTNGRTFEFRDDGLAVFPDRTFHFDIGLDHVLDDFDYFDERHSGNVVRTWAFRWKGEKLELLRTKQLESGGDEIVDPHPAFLLRRLVNER